jgi:phospholipid/cholesterol/gamma-HCH transport system substrate-binding protein
MTTKLIRLGAFIVVAALLAGYIGLKLANISFHDRYTVGATFGDVTGLRVGDVVKLAGVPVGQVTSIHLRDGDAVVRFSVDKSVRLPVDKASASPDDNTTVSVRWRNLIGQRYVLLEPGVHAVDAKAFLPTNGKAEIDARFTKSVVDIGAVFNALDPLGQAINPQQLNDIFTALTQALDGNDGSVQSLVQSLGTLSGTLAQRDQTIQQMLGDYQTVTGVLARRDTQIQTMLENLTTLSQSFTDNTALFERSLADIASAGGSLNRLLTSTETQFRGAVDGLAGVAHTIANKLPQLETLLNSAPSAFKALFSATSYGDFLRVDATCLQLAPMPCTLLGGYSVP